MSLRRGDTIIEILFALSVFSLIAIVSINLMNNGVATAQASLENNMVRNEINAQAEAIRFIHGAATTGSSATYSKLWDSINAIAAQNTKDISGFQYPPQDNSCKTYYDDAHLGAYNAFVLNTRNLQGKSEDVILKYNSGHFEEAGNYARVFYSGINEDALNTDTAALDIHNAFAQGMWTIAVPSAQKFNDKKTPIYYDFYIQSCWYHPGSNTPSTIDTTIRLYNPSPTEGQ